MTGEITQPTEISEYLWAALTDYRYTLIELSHALHADPEVGGVEYRAAERITALLDSEGFEPGDVPADLPTAFNYRYGRHPFTVTVCVEYDALPGIGHACGHNVNAAVAIGAALALRTVADSLEISVQVLGTPDEESTGAKADLLAAGSFDDSTIAMMAHASDQDTVGAGSLALCMWTATFTGVPAHAAASPESGVNALDALVVAQTAIALARQQLPPESVVSINVTDGGSAVNIIPERAGAVIEMRSSDSGHLETVRRKVRACLEGAAIATGCTLSVSPAGNTFDNLRQDPGLSESYRRALRARGRVARFTAAKTASTDMGNVSQVVPSIHPQIGYEAGGTHPHTAEFAEYGTSESADRAIMDGAFGLAAAAAAAALDPVERDRLLMLRSAKSR